MPVGKEFEQRSVGEEIAIKEVEGYIERIEKKGETSQPQSPLQPAATTTSAPVVYDDMGQVVMQANQSLARPKIVLPLDAEEIDEGMHSKAWKGLRWLVVWCKYMIYKYPGRVFYPVKERHG